MNELQSCLQDSPGYYASVNKYVKLESNLEFLLQFLGPNPGMQSLALGDFPNSPQINFIQTSFLFSILNSIWKCTGLIILKFFFMDLESAYYP